MNRLLLDLASFVVGAAPAAAIIAAGVLATPLRRWVA